MNLRALLIEAMADSLRGDLRIGSTRKTIYEWAAIHALNAALEVLTDNADETIHGRQAERLGDAAVEDLILSLRDS